MLLLQGIALVTWLEDQMYHMSDMKVQYGWWGAKQGYLILAKTWQELLVTASNKAPIQPA